MLKIKNREVIVDIGGGIEDFPKYTTQIINLANQNSGGTRPKVVGQMSELIKEFPGNNYLDWVNWYQKQMPNAIEDACPIAPMFRKSESCDCLMALRHSNNSREVFPVVATTTSCVSTFVSISRRASSRDIRL